MNTVILKIKDIESLNTIQQKLHSASHLGKNLTKKEKEMLAAFLSGLPSANNLLSKDLGELTPFELSFEVKVWDLNPILPHLEQWRTLFSGFPSRSGPVQAKIVDSIEEDNADVVKENVIIESYFAPSLAHSNKGRYISIFLKTDGTARFLFDTIEDLNDFPELYNFKGSWKEAYLIVTEILNKGWIQDVPSLEV
jgi:hypothetical protein